MIELASRPANARNRRSRSYDGKGAGAIMIPMDSFSTLENFMSLAQWVTEVMVNNFE
jgi:hypothetical protein